MGVWKQINHTPIRPIPIRHIHTNKFFLINLCFMPRLRQKILMNTVLHRYDKFQDRHIGPDAEEQQEMLTVIGAATLDDLIDQTIPPSIRLKQPLKGVKAKTETEFLEEFKAIASHNKIYKSYIGMGYY